LRTRIGGPVKRLPPARTAVPLPTILGSSPRMTRGAGSCPRMTGDESVQRMSTLRPLSPRPSDLIRPCEAEGRASKQARPDQAPFPTDKALGAPTPSAWPQVGIPKSAALPTAFREGPAHGARGRPARGLARPASPAPARAAGEFGCRDGADRPEAQETRRDAQWSRRAASARAGVRTATRRAPHGQGRPVLPARRSCRAGPGPWCASCPAGSRSGRPRYRSCAPGRYRNGNGRRRL
jgi:hypothetical protein